jgi:hypothetical protein
MNIPFLILTAEEIHRHPVSALALFCDQAVDMIHHAQRFTYPLVQEEILIFDSKPHIISSCLSRNKP